MAKYGLLIDYGFCTGCHACEIACKREHNRPEEEWGMTVNEIEPEKSGGKIYFIPFPTDNCNLCGKRVSKGRQPACVQSCWTSTMKFGTIQELTESMKKNRKMVLWAPH
ncbi:MAG: 4Fe-4S dicluster domain-containing protein [Chloroflexota bacterium]